MRYTILVTGSPYQTKACHSAYTFCKALTESEHQLSGVFFYQDAVLIGNRLAHPPRDEQDLRKEWISLASQHQIPLHLCIAAAIRRGIVDEGEKERYSLDASSIDPAFHLEGLGTLVQLMTETDKLITFR